MSGLLSAKLHRPVLSPRLVKRPSLIVHLNEGLTSYRQVTLVSAPAGFGKTTIVSEWISGMDKPVAWLSLDPADDDPGRFFSYLIAAIQNVNKSFGREIEGVLLAGQLPPKEIISATLANDLLAMEKQFLLVLDDFQVIQDPCILQILGDLIENQPEALYLVLLTREDPSLPLARLRANNHLTEIRAADLRFSIAETNDFLNQVMGLSLTTSDISTLAEKTEGWAAGLHLVGLSIRDRAKPSEFIANLSGSHRFILNYLTEEVLNHQEEDTQQFLLQTSILSRFNGDLCNIVTDRINSHSLLEDLYKNNLFLIPLDDKGHWYRYHQLFADLLKNRLETLQKDQIPRLHLLASQWHREKGMISEAIQHALLAEEYPTAVELIEKHAMDMLMQWHLKTVETWMQAIPKKWVAQSPRANLAFAWTYLMRANHEQAFPYLQQLGVMFSNPQTTGNTIKEDPTLEAKWLALQSMLLNAQGKQRESLQACQQALEIAPEGDNQVLSMIYLGLANVYQQMNDYDQALEAFQTLINIGQHSGNSVSELLGVSGMGLLAIQHGQYHFAYELVTRGIERIESSGALPPISTAVYGELGVIHYQWNQLELAHQYFQKSIQVSTLSGTSDAELYYGVILSRLSQIQGDLVTASQKIQKAFDLMKVEAPSAVREEVNGQRVRIYLAQDDPLAAEAVLKQQGFSFQEALTTPELDESQAVHFFSRDTITRKIWLPYISALRILLYRARKFDQTEYLQSGLELAGRLIENALHYQYIPLGLETVLVRAQLHTAVGNKKASQKDYQFALELGQPEGLISIFLEEGLPAAEALSELLDQKQLESVDPGYVHKILTAFSSGYLDSIRSKPAPDVLISPLSERELEILQLINEGLSNQEITERLTISLHTVKKHSSNIYLKLGVNSRTQAVARARKLGLL